jgi:diguanylate cyclase (GGDEF)-like protein
MDDGGREDCGVRDIVKALRLLDEVEGSKGSLYDRFGEAFPGHEPASTTFIRLGLDQASRRNVIAYQTRIVVRNSAVFRGLQVNCADFETLRQILADLRQAPVPSCEQAATVALAVETRTWELFEHELFGVLQAHFAPFVDSLRKGCERHLALLGSLQREVARGTPLPGPAAGPVPLGTWQAAEAASHTTRPARETTAIWSAPPKRGTAEELLGSVDPARLLKILGTLDEGVFLLDESRRIVYQNGPGRSGCEGSLSSLQNEACAPGGVCPSDEEGLLSCREACELKRAMRLEVDRSGLFWRLLPNQTRAPAVVHVHPLRGKKGETVGALHVLASRAVPAATGDRIDELERLAYLDGLTGLANRRYLEVTMLSRLNELQRYQREFGVLFADVDCLKAVNDSYGHLEGDRVLRAVAETLAGNVRSSDLFGRWGGDEFLGILSSMDAAQLMATAEKLRALLAASTYKVGGEDLRISVSIGATVASPEDSLETLIARADRLMFHSKSEGRDRVTGDTSAASPAPASVPRECPGARGVRHQHPV